MSIVELKDVIPLAQRPSRYIGGEVNSIRKDHAKCGLSFALAFPDAYEVGMSHLGIQILYAILNGEEHILAERFFAPWPDMESLMRRNHVPLASLESGTPLNRFDIVGFSLQYELSYTNVLNMLDLGGVSIYAADRREDAPIVIAGGPCAFNPAPMVPFFDAFVIGEGEEVILEISRSLMQGKKRGYGRRSLVAILSEIEGVYVPSIHREGGRIKKRIVRDINDWHLPREPVIPLMKSIHDRITLEIARGCTRGCRFCQAGMVWRPVRERSMGTLKQMADDMISATGYDEVSLLSLSSGDYSRIESLLTSLMNRYCERKIALALPSMRTETLTETLIEQVKRVRKTSFTLAPEAGTQRLRNVINKGNTEDDLLSTAGRVFDAGWRSIKLYFMLGLPTEQQEDLDGIVDLAYRVLREGGNRRQVTVSLSTFVPKPHTPFQWHRQISLDETIREQEFFRKHIRHRNLKLKWHDGRMSLLEGVLSRGDEGISALIERAFLMGCRFDGWSDQFRFDLWDEAMGSLHLQRDAYLDERHKDEALPWKGIDCGVSDDFLLREYKKSLTGEETKDCRFGRCHDCGVCKKGVNIMLAAIDTVDEERDSRSRADGEPVAIRKIRVRFARKGNVRFLSHLETASALVKGITIGGLAFVFSEGFHPAPRVSFPFATPVGIESTYEYADIQIRDPSRPVEEYIDTINRALPAGMEILDARDVPTGGATLSAYIVGLNYEVHLPQTVSADKTRDFRGMIDRFLALSAFDIPRIRKGKETMKDIRPFVESLSFDEGQSVVSMTLGCGSQGGANPLEIVRHVLGLSDSDARMALIRKTGVVFSDGGRLSDNPASDA